MRRALAIILIALVAAFFSLAPSPAADAQYAPVFPAPFDCLNLNPPTVTVVDEVVIVIFAPESAECIESVLVQLNPVLYRGPLPASLELQRDIPRMGPELDTIVTTARLYDGSDIIVRTKFTPYAEGDAAASSGGGATSGTQLVSTGADEVAGVQVSEGSGTTLAVTGSSVSLPLALGAALLGTGGLVLLAARKREFGSAG